MKNKIEEIKMKILNKDAFLLEVQKSIYNKICMPKINEEVLNLAYTTIFSYRDILFANEIIQDIKRLKFSDKDLDETSRSELLKNICILATFDDKKPMELAIDIWDDSEKYSNGLKIDMIKRLKILELSLQGI